MVQSLNYKMGKVAAVLAKGKPAKVLVTTHGCELKSSGMYNSTAHGVSNTNLINYFAITKDTRNHCITSIYDISREISEM